MKIIKLFFTLVLYCTVLANVNAATYQYDKLNRLTSVTYDSGQTISYTYDASGNILSESSSGGLSGDYDGDNDIDRNDLLIMRGFIGQTETAPNNSHDLDGDGKVTVLDFRKLATLCTLPRCAIQ